jgi:hypothetical protein
MRTLFRFSPTLFFLALTQSGCALLGGSVAGPRARAAERGGPIEYKGEDLAAVPAEQVVVYTMHHQQPLPDGISLDSKTRQQANHSTAAQFIADGGPEKLLVLLEGFPTADDPHRRIGVLSTRSVPGQDERALAARFAAEAGRHGANAIYVLPGRIDSTLALALHVSSASPSAHWPAAKELLEKEHAGFRDKDLRPSGAPLRRDLAQPEAIQIDARRGTCYAIAFALEPDATLSAHARRALAFAVTSPDYEIQHTDAHLTGDWPIDRRSGTHHLGCPQTGGAMTVDLQASFGSAMKDAKVHDLGSGPVLFQLYSHPITEAQLKERARKAKQAWDEARARSRAFNKEHCALCNGPLMLCGTKDPRSCDVWKDCLSRNYVHVDDCLGQ